MTEEGEAAPPMSAADAARARADARRRRILQKSGQRMGIVSGDPQPAAGAGAEGPTPPAEGAGAAEGAPATAAAGAATSTETTTTAVTDPSSATGGSAPDASAPAPVSSTSSGSSRLQAMRRRRFKKAASQKPSESSITDADKASDSGEGTGAKAESGSTPQEVSKAATTDVPALTTATDKSDGPSSSADTSTAAAAAPKRKWKGVARARREKIEERQKSEAKNVGATARGSSVSGSSSSQRSLNKSTSGMAGSFKKPASSKLPIYMHIVTVVLLFVVGYDIGSDQFVHPHTVQRRLSPTENGIGILRIGQSSQPAVVDPKAVLMMETYGKEGDDTADEFGGDNDGDGSKKEKNIDPLFQVDLDEFTEGDGLLMMLGRGAVFVHRINLKIFYYTPLAVLTAVWRIPQKLLATPPVLFLVCIVIRQFAKRILGAKLPEPEKENDKTDFLAMAKNSIIGFLTNLFPTAVELYDVFNHLRSDMLVVLCGIFTAYVMTHTIGGGSAAIPEMPTGEEL